MEDGQNKRCQAVVTNAGGDALEGTKTSNRKYVKEPDLRRRVALFAENVALERKTINCILYVYY